MVSMWKAFQGAGANSEKDLLLDNVRTAYAPAAGPQKMTKTIQKKAAFQVPKSKVIFQKVKSNTLNGIQKQKGSRCRSNKTGHICFSHGDPAKKLGNYLCWYYLRFPKLKASRAANIGCVMVLCPARDQGMDNCGQVTLLFQEQP